MKRKKKISPRKMFLCFYVVHDMTEEVFVIDNGREGEHNNDKELEKGLERDGSIFLITYNKYSMCVCVVCYLCHVTHFHIEF